MPQFRMVYYIGECVDTKASFTYFRMAVLTAGKQVFAVIYVDSTKPFQPDVLIKLPQHSVQVVYYVIARIIYMAGIETNPELFLQFNPVDYLPQSLEP